jgi:hypothetical protein
MLLLQLLQGRMCEYCVHMIRILLATPSIVASFLALVLHPFQCTRGSFLFPGPEYRTEILDCTTCKMERKHTHTQENVQNKAHHVLDKLYIHSDNAQKSKHHDLRNLSTASNRHVHWLTLNI